MSYEPGRANLATSAALVDELASSGLRHAVCCPGSRSTPIAVALAAHDCLRLWMQVDERSAAFFALGMARQLHEPVALLSTSGTAAANFHPGVTEASLGRVPLVVLTADRPPELRDWGAAQTIDQIRLFGRHVKWSVDMPVPDGSHDLVRHARAVAARAVATARQDPAGPVHLNVPFREPLLPAEPMMLPDIADLFGRDRVASPRRRDQVSHGSASESTTAALADTIAREPRGLIVCGPGDEPGLAAAAAALAAVSSYPILADPLSGARFGAHERSAVVDAYDPLLRATPRLDALYPDVVIRVGALPTSKPLQQLLAAQPSQTHILVDPGDSRDPSHLATNHIRADPADTLCRLARAVEMRQRSPAGDWMECWVAGDRIAAAAVAEAIAAIDRPFEGRAAAEVAALLPDGATLVIGNSMPIRDVDAFVRGDQRRLRLVANRGANGIDGVVSSALGAAAVAAGPVVLLIGDLSFYHDLNGLLAAKLMGIDATIVVLNNDGGGIFSFLPQADQLDAATFELLFGTPIGLDIAAAARLYGASYARPAGWPAFRRQLRRAMNPAGLSILEHVTDRRENVSQHREVWAHVNTALKRSGWIHT